MPLFDPRPSARFAVDVMRQAQAEGALIGRVAVWAWLPDSGEHEFTKDLDIAVSRASLRKIRDWLNQRGVRSRELPIGGIKVRDSDAGVDVDFIERTKQGDLSGLFEEAIAAARDAGLTIRVADDVQLPLAAAEYVVAMKIGAGDSKDEKDARRLLKVATVDVEKVRDLVRRHLGVGTRNRLEAILREINHPAAHPGYSESDS